MLANTDLKKVLVDQKVIALDDLDKLEREAKDKKQTLASYLVFRKIIPEDKLTQLASDFLQFPFVELSAEKIPQEVLKIIPEPIARRHHVIAFRQNGEELDLAMTEPEDM